MTPRPPDQVVGRELVPLASFMTSRKGVCIDSAVKRTAAQDILLLTKNVWEFGGGLWCFGILPGLDYGFYWTFQWQKSNLRLLIPQWSI